MKLAIVDLSEIAYDPLTPEHAPLGGMQSGACYLSRALMARGHDLTIFNAAGHAAEIAGMAVRPARTGLVPGGLSGFDAVISLSCEGRRLRACLGDRPLILYSGHNTEEPSVQVLRQAEERDSWDRYVFKSNWQAETFRKTFGLDRRRLCILTNAAAPCFHAIPERTSYFFLENRPPVLYFSSTPFRGLDILAEAFPRVAAAFPGVKARVFSSMATYQDGAENEKYAGLYEACRNAGIDYVGSLGQRALAAEIAKADVLAFPSTYPETSCVTVMEAMANAAPIVSRSLGALPETAAGFADLMPVARRQDRRQLAVDYADFLVHALRRYRDSPAKAVARLRLQKRYAAVNYNWTRKAEEWEAFLVEVLRARPLGGTEARAKSPAPQVFNYVQTIAGRRIYFDPRDSRGWRLLAAGGSFNPATMALWSAALRRVDWNLVVDVGANYGEMLIDPALGQVPRVVAVEPNPFVLPHLRASLDGVSNAVIVDAALSDAEGERPFLADRDWSGLSGLGTGAGQIAVRTTTLDALVRQFGPGPGQGLKLLLKVDVEGEDAKVLRGGLASIALAAEFCGLVEVSHLSATELQELDARFAGLALDMAGNRIVPLPSLAALRGRPGLWQQDVLLARKGVRRSD